MLFWCFFGVFFSCFFCAFPVLFLVYFSCFFSCFFGAFPVLFLVCFWCCFLVFFWCFFPCFFSCFLVVFSRVFLRDFYRVFFCVFSRVFFRAFLVLFLVFFRVFPVCFLVFCSCFCLNTRCITTSKPEPNLQSRAFSRAFFVLFWCFFPCFFSCFFGAFPVPFLVFFSRAFWCFSRAFSRVFFRAFWVLFACVFCAFLVFWKQIEQFWKQIEPLFQHDQVTINVKQASKDLGCMLQYSKRIVLGCIKDRMLAAGRRLGKLAKQQISLREKASKIQAAIWPLAFYGAESQLIGDVHFSKLRRQASDVLVGPHKYASSFLALHVLYDKVEDPLLYVLATALCSFRRLFYYHPHLAAEMWERVCSAPPRYGPCGALAGYLAKVHWLPKPEGAVQMPSGQEIFRRIQSTKEIRLILKQAWSFFVFQQVQHRKGVTLQPFDFYTQHKVLQKLSDNSLRLVALNLTGGFQTSNLGCDCLRVVPFLW